MNLPKSRLEAYLQNVVEYTDTSMMSGVAGACCPVMDVEEDNIMKETAKILCSNGGSVLNVGFGMGIIDGYIKSHNPSEHIMIEAHPMVVEHANSLGFEPILGKWEDIIPKFIEDGRKFDSIYFDTFTFDYQTDPQWGPFTKLVPQLLNRGGIYSFFNDIASKVEKVEEIIEPWGWERNVKYVSYIERKEPEGSKVIIPTDRGDYELVWYVSN